MTTRSNEKGRTDAKKEIRNENPFRIFENEKFGKIEVLFKDEQFYFPAIEIAEILGYKNPRDAVKRHCVNEFPYVVFHDVGINTGLAVQTIQKKYINEGNLYRLIAKSKLPEARPKAETYDEFLDADGTITSTTLAISFGLQSARLFNEIMHFYDVIAKVGKSWRPSQKYINAGIMKAVEFGYNPHKKKNENSPLLLENNLNKSNEVSTEIEVLNSDNVISEEKETKGVMFKWTLTGLEVAKRILLENGYIEKLDGKYIANSEKIAEFKKNYKRAKQKN